MYQGVIYDGQHQPLIDDETWHQVQAVLEGRRLSGDRAWRHEHYLKGSVFCANCDSRLGFSYCRGKGGLYPYFFCLGRNKKRTECDLPYLPAEKVTEFVTAQWQHLRFSPALIAAVRRSVDEELADQESKDEVVLATQRKRLQQLERTRSKLLDAYLAEAIWVRLAWSDVPLGVSAAS